MQLSVLFLSCMGALVALFCESTEKVKVWVMGWAAWARLGGPKQFHWATPIPAALPHCLWGALSLLCRVLCAVSSTHPSHKVVPEKRNNSSRRGKNGTKGWKEAGEVLSAQLDDGDTWGREAEEKGEQSQMQSWGKACRAVGWSVCARVCTCVCACLWRCELGAAQGQDLLQPLFTCPHGARGREGLGQSLPSGWGMPEPGLSFVWNNRGLGPIVLPCTPSRKASPLGQGLHGAACEAALRGALLAERTRTRTWTSPAPGALQVNSPVDEALELSCSPFLLCMIQALGRGLREGLWGGS